MITSLAMISGFGNEPPTTTHAPQPVWTLIPSARFIARMLLRNIESNGAGRLSRGSGNTATGLRVLGLAIFHRSRTLLACCKATGFRRLLKFAATTPN